MQCALDRHPNIISFKESFSANKHLYIVMDYADGTDSQAHICVNPPPLPKNT